MAEGSNKKGSPFSIYWIYALIGVAIIGYQIYFGYSNELTLNNQNTFFELAENGYVKDVHLVNKVKVEFKLNEDGKTFVKQTSETKYKLLKKALTDSKVKRGEQEIEFKIADAGVFQNQVNELNKEIKKNNTTKAINKSKSVAPVNVAVIDEPDYLGSIISFILPILILGFIWFFVMRRM